MFASDVCVCVLGGWGCEKRRETSRDWDVENVHTRNVENVYTRNVGYGSKRYMNERERERERER
jgi:hypothetical protein